MRFMLFIKHSESYRSHTVPPGLYEAMGKFVTEAMASGVVTDTAGLKPTSDATAVRLNDGKISIVDGPFAESKEIVGGYALIKVKSRREAMDLATQFMEIHRVHWPEFNGECELRPLEDYDAA